MTLCILFLFVSLPVHGQHSAALAWQQPIQTAPEVVASTNVYRDSVKYVQGIAATVLTYTDTAVNAGETHTYALTNVDTAGVESPLSLSVTAVIPGGIVPPPPSCQGTTFFSSGVGPTSTYGNDPQPVNVGIKLSAKVPWIINCVRFFRATDSSGNVPSGNVLWTIYNASTKAALATGTFPTSTVSGWNVAPLVTPLNVAANTSVVVAVNTIRYADTYPYFSTAKTDPTGVLTAPANAGTFLYSASNAFPTTVWQASNYFVDIVFTSVLPPPPPPTPTLTESCVNTTTSRVCTYTETNQPGASLTSTGTAGGITITNTGAIP